MAYCVFHRDSTQLIKVFNLKSSALRSKTCMNRNAGSDAYDVTDMEYYQDNIVHTKKVKNIMTNEEIEIPSNTSRSCDPSSETYWSM